MVFPWRMDPWFIPASIALSLVIAHVTKMYVHRIRTGEWSLRTLLWDTGGMPSGHSAVVAALATSIFLVEGPNVPFWISLVLALVVIRDAFGVRQSVSDQARLLNILTSHVNLQKKVKIVLGHTPLQVLIGALLGVAVPTALYFLL